jgi:tetratricopeptide (TPR) repeat protein
MGQRQRRKTARGPAGAETPSGGNRRVVNRGRSWLAAFAAAAIVGALLYAGASAVWDVTWAARLPPLPDLGDYPGAVREHLAAADRAARAMPRSTAAVGELGLAYHADMFYAEAERCYELAERLSGGAWQWTYYRALTHGARGDTEGLSAGLRQVIAVVPDVGPAWWRLGEAAFKRRDHAKKKKK